MQLKNNTYQIQGVNVLDICEEFGTPVYVYDSEKIRERYESLTSAFSGQPVKIKYAAKALTNINILKYIKKLGAGLDVVSIQEAQLGLLAGFSPNDIMITPNCVSFDEIREAVDLGLQINIDNIPLLEQFGHEYGDKVPICVRINPHILAGGNAKISVGHIDSKFGISILQTRHLYRIVETHNIRVNGVHMHTGSDILDADVFLRGAQVVFDIAKEFKNLEFLDFGSGFKVGYRDGDVTTDVFLLGKRLGEAIDNFAAEYGSKPEIWFEPGKYLVSESGYLFVKTNVIKTTPATAFVGVDSGMNHLLRPMMYDAYHDIINISNPSGTKRVYSVVGYICETDTFGWDRALNEVKEGDILAIKNAGAYGFSMSSNYNSRFKPPEVFVYNGKANLIRKRETFEDLTRNQIEIALD
ncbi:diaminopimelate decarboxylase [Marinigracilibium pacificum]|uniref:Diaminopimelate decarboxylase n=1 Tax=Marinigracilibium pacificum TaxID=2729599 RepID=A0A848IU97_9BACT|nr:diaminopimelate decarboxylase [Marinigracilibium pacificum]NMM46768.1 diaminopimelate decarboxylase [Marinigracilibium pacificum]